MIRTAWPEDYDPDGYGPLQGMEDDRPPELDWRDAWRARQHEIIKRRINWHEVRLEMLQKICEGMLEHHHRFHAMLELLQENPVNSPRDLSNYLRSCGPRDGKALGLALLRIAGQVCLRHYQKVESELPF
jgi:hypothetical protein